APRPRPAQLSPKTCATQATRPRRTTPASSVPRNSCRNSAARPADTTALAGDIDASGTAGWNNGAGFVPIRHFRGTLDGRGHVISDLHINLGSEADGHWAGMFANTNKGSEVRNLGLKHATVTVKEGESVGSLIGNLQGSARNVWADADMEAEETVGGLVGSIAGDGELENAWSAGTVTADRKG